MMPDIDGLQLCKMIRAEPSLQYTYIILLTSLDSKGSYLEGMDAGADDFITKPFDEEQLAARLRVAERILALHKKLTRRLLTTALPAYGIGPQSWIPWKRSWSGQRAKAPAWA